MDKHVGGAGHVDNILLALGSTGRYQWFQVSIVLLSTVAAAFQLLSNVFTCRDVPHHCAAPLSNTSDFFQQFDEYDNVTFEYDTCSIFVRSHDQVIDEQPCLFGIEYELPIDTSAVSQFDLVCGRKSLAKLSQTLVIVGQGIGAIFTTILSDRYGRKVVLVISNIALGSFGMVLAYAPSFPVFATFKFLTGCVQQGVITGAYTFSCELFPIPKRRLSLVLNGVWFAGACMLLSLVSYLCSGLSWRTMQAVYCLTSLAFLVDAALMDESLRWLLANGKSEKAIKVIQKAARWNKKKFSDIMMAYNDESKTELTKLQEAGGEEVHGTPDGAPVILTSAEKITLLDVLRVPRLLVNAVVMWLAWFTSALGFFAIYLNSASLSGDQFVNFFLVAVMEGLATVECYLILNRAGRRITQGSQFVTLAFSLLTVAVLRQFEPTAVLDVLVLIFTLLGMIGAGGAFIVVFTYTPEMFPTNCRNQALGVSSFMGRIGGMLAPFTAFLAAYVSWGPGVLIGGCSIVVAILMKFLPETAHRELPQTLEDLKRWYEEDDTQEGTDKEKNGKV